MDEPIFEVIDKEEGRNYKVYVNGQIEGFGHGKVVINGIPARIRKAYAKGMEEGRRMKS